MVGAHSIVFDEYVRTFADIARSHLGKQTWDEVEPTLAIGWAQLPEQEIPSWSVARPLVLALASDEPTNTSRLEPDT